MHTQQTKAQKILVAMSGGVDSSVAALKLIEQGYDVAAMFMKNWEAADENSPCPALQDLEDAKTVCNTLNIKLHTVNFSHEYWENVFAYFLAEYKQGRTPNPDILCNSEIKFKTFLNYANALGYNKIATGHYANVRYNNTNYELLRAEDTTKDQSYFLHALNQDQLSAAVFPLAHINKTAVRQIAEQNNLITSHKKDSTGICFIGSKNFPEFIRKQLTASLGDIVAIDANGNKFKVGEHDGVIYYTIGQRKGLNIGGHKNSIGNPWYVVNKDVTNNILYVSQFEKYLLNNALFASNINWINQPTHNQFDCTAQIRYRQKAEDCHVQIDPNNPTKCKVVFARPQRAITEGQSVVFYTDNVCLGGGIIVEHLNERI